MQSINVRRSVTVDPQLTAQQWDLYCETMDCSEVVAQLNNTLRRCVNDGMSREEVERAMLCVMQQYHKYGACDSEPYGVLQEVLDGIFGWGD
jgi:hypothetical protein